MSKKLIVLFALMIFVAGLSVFSTKSEAMPNFARKYSADCTMCHTIIPQLNRIGYEFRMAGYRLPSEIGQDEKPFKLGDFFAARVQTHYSWKKHTDVNSANDYTSSQLKFKEFTMYPLTGSWGKYFGSLAELSVGIPEEWEVENAYVRGVYGNENGWFQGRIGVFHAWEGFGASDRPLGTMRPLIQGKMGMGVPFKAWPGGETGAEVGYYSAKTGTAVSAVLWNGMNADGNAAGKTLGHPGYNDKDIQLFVNQFFRDDSAVSIYYYKGVAPFPASGVQTRDSYQRLIAYANFWPIREKLNLKAGYGYGHDSLSDNTVAGGANVGNSKGFFGEVDYIVIPAKVEVGARYDYLDPSNKISHNNQKAYTFSVNAPLMHGLQFIGDYQHKTSEQPTGKNKDDTLEARVIFIW